MNHGVEEANADQEDEEIPELEEASVDDNDGGDREEESEEQEEEAGHEQAGAAHRVMEEPRKEEEKKVVDAIHKLRVMTSAEIEQQSSPGRFTVYVDRPPASVAEAMRDIKAHFSKVAEIAGEVSVLLEVVPYQKKGTILLSELLKNYPLSCQLLCFRVQTRASEHTFRTCRRAVALIIAILYVDSSNTCSKRGWRGR
jgi:hypothetical protein